MAVLYVMRHGESVVNVDHRLTCRRLDGALTDRGRDQARRAGLWLADKGIRQIMASHFERAQETAAIIGEWLRLPVNEDPDLGEMDCGSLDWRTDDEGWAIFTGVYERWLSHDLDARYPDGESLREGFARLARALDAAAKHDENTLIVTHGGITRTVVPYLCVNAAALQRVKHLDNTGIITLEPYDEGRYSCTAWNLLAHLE